MVVGGIAASQVYTIVVAVYGGDSSHTSPDGRYVMVLTVMIVIMVVL